MELFETMVMFAILDGLHDGLYHVDRPTVTVIATITSTPFCGCESNACAPQNPFHLNVKDVFGNDSVSENNF